MSNGFLNDYSTGFPKLVAPASGLVRPPNTPGSENPPGPANFPVVPAKPMSNTDLLHGILKQLTYQNIARMPHIRSSDVDANGQTLDWSMVGLMDTLMIRNKGPKSVWIAFDIDGPAVDNFSPSDLSWELLANESVNITLCQFYKIGLRCAASETGSVHAIAFQAVAGDLGGSIS
jgi:hypothetical protein